MPRFAVTHELSTREIHGVRALCDGCDPARPCDEHARGASLWVVTRGAFELRDASGRHVLDPMHALVMPAGHPFVIRHPAGPDTCVAFHGPLIERIAERGPRIAAIAPGHVARLAAHVAAFARGEGDELALGELLVELAADEPAHRDREVADAIEHVLRLAYAEPLSLGELADRAGYSLFHTCRVFRATTGQTLHGFRRELRLRHALARIVDGDEPLIQIAAVTGFANQSHLTNLFRARFGITPGRARTRDGLRQLATA
ncbi:MAG TPA: helix-turn-helix transcriptional regulator [Kofleriaceae bacterium]|nr:helix-turn-helix transcriptional regulator [Kofleriaceae bacterium]